MVEKMNRCYLMLSSLLLLSTGGEAFRQSLGPATRHHHHQAALFLLFASPRDTNEEETSSPLQEALARADERALNKDAPAWLQGHDSLPFSCTACGKCCMTKGLNLQVYLSPQDVSASAKIMNLTPTRFTQKFASHTLGFTNEYDEATTWIRLKEQDGGCILLDENNQCKIYETRPVQCRTYPFWPNLLASPAAWDQECRRPDDDTANLHLPLWTPEEGGCEGMRPIGSESHDDDDSSSLASTSSDVVAIDEVSRQLYEYVAAGRRYPSGAREWPVAPSPT